MVHLPAASTNHKGFDLADLHQEESDQVVHPLTKWVVLHQAEDQVVSLPQEAHLQEATLEICSVTHLNEQVGVHLPHIREQGNAHRFRPYYQKPLSIVHRR